MRGLGWARVVVVCVGCEGGRSTDSGCSAGGPAVPPCVCALRVQQRASCICARSELHARMHVCMHARICHAWRACATPHLAVADAEAADAAKRAAHRRTDDLNLPNELGDGLGFGRRVFRSVRQMPRCTVTRCIRPHAASCCAPPAGLACFRSHAVRGVRTCPGCRPAASHAPRPRAPITPNDSVSSTHRRYLKRSFRSYMRLFKRCAPTVGARTAQVSRGQVARGARAQLQTRTRRQAGRCN